MSSPKVSDRLSESRPGLVAFLFRRAVASFVSLVVFVAGVFVLIDRLIPYDNAAVGAGDSVRVGFVDYMAGLARGDLGQSYSGAPVGGLISEALPTTFLIFATGGILAYLLGSWLGRVVEWRRGSIQGGMATGVGLVLSTMFPPLLIFLLVYFGRDPLLSARSALGLPSDSLVVFRDVGFDEARLVSFGGRALLLTLLVALAVRAFGRRRGWRLLPALVLPAALLGMVLAIARLGVGQQALDVFLFRSSRKVEIGAGSPVLAVVAFLLVAFGEVMFVWRAGIADERSEDYVLTARAKAVPEHLIRDRHVARNVALPVLARSFAALPFLLTGLIIIEYQVQIGSCALSQGAECVYWSGGLSTTLFSAVRSADTPVIVGVLVTMGVLLLVLRLVAETAQAALDPRIRLGARR
ncbi:MAG: ABC transporter permease [Acidimicrobiia bacterium]